MPDSIETQVAQLQTTIATLEAQRAVLGDAMVAGPLAALRQQLTALEAQLQPAPAEERRLITILFADIVGSAALAEKLDPEEWRATVAHLHFTVGNIITSCGGRVAQYLGDGLLALFGADQTSERDPENAIRAALEFQTALGDLKAPHKIQLRVGIHTGLVVVGELGAEAHKEFTATGDAMTLASRLQAAAPAGGVLISHDTYRYVRGVFDVTPQPPLTVKGKTEPLQTYLIRRAKPRPFRTVQRGVAGLQTRTVGRAAEFQCLQEAYLDAYQNRRIVWVQLRGEAGVGKSRLLDDLRDWVELRPETVRVFRGRAFAGDEAQPYALVHRMLFDRFQIADDTPLPEAETLWVNKFREVSGIPEVELPQALGLLVGLPFHGSPYIGAMRQDPKQVKGRALVVSREFLTGTRSMMPVEVLLEDLQWTDESSWEWLTEVVLSGDSTSETRTPGDAGHLPNGMFILATARLEWQPPEALQRAGSGSSAVRYIELPLAPLSDVATRELAHELLGEVEGVPEEVMDLIVERAEGIPYYAEEIVNWFVDRGIIDKGRHPWHFNTGRLKETPLPTTLQHLLLTRLGSLSDAEQAALQRGAIFGRHFWSGGVEALGVHSSIELLEGLQPRGLVEEQPESSLAGETEWSFHQTLLRDVTYESILKRERTKLHQAAAVWLEEQAGRAGRLDEFAGLIGEHCERAGESSAAADWYLRAGEVAQRASALTEARRLFDRALELLPPIDRERRWRAHLGREAVLDFQGAREAQRADLTALQELAEALDDDARRALASFREMMYVRTTGDWRSVVSAADTAIAAARRAGNAGLEVRVLALQTSVLGRAGEVAAALEMAPGTLARAQAVGDDAALAFALGRVATAYNEAGERADAAALYSQAIEIVQRIGDRREQALFTLNLGGAYLALGLYKLARNSLEQALAQCAAIGERRLHAYAMLNLGEVYLRLGDSRTARRWSEQALSALRAIGDAYGHGMSLIILGYIVEQVGDYAGAVQHFTEARETLSRIGDAAGVTEATAGLARCALAQGRLEEARPLNVEVWNYVCAHGVKEMELALRAYVTVADIFDALGEATESRAAVEAGYHDLISRAEKISNPEWRQALLENVEEHRALLEMWRRTQR